MPTVDQLLELFEGRDWEGYLPEEIVENVVNTVVEFLPGSILKVGK